MKALAYCAVLLLASTALAQTTLDVSIAIAIAEAEAAHEQPAVPKRTIFQPPQQPQSPLVVPRSPSPKSPQRQLITSPRWLQNGHSVTVSHLISTHGFTRAQLAGLTQSQLDDLHSDAHNRASSARTVTRSPSPCPGGVCPTTRRGIFRRR